MPRARRVLNGFTAKDVCKITGITAPMLEYLRRHDFLRPGHLGGTERRQGRVRYYTYRDLVVAKLIQRLRIAGVRLHVLKGAVERMARDEFWKDGTTPADGLKWVVSDGSGVYLRDQDGFLDDITGSGQRSFAFVVNVERLSDEVRKDVPTDRRAAFTMAAESLRYEDAPPHTGVAAIGN